VSLASELGDDDVANVTADAEKLLVESVPDRHTPDDAFALERKQECRWNKIRRDIHAAFPFLEHLKIASEGHSFLVIVEEIRGLRRGRAVRPQELALFVLSRPAKHHHLWLHS